MRSSFLSIAFVFVSGFLSAQTTITQSSSSVIQSTNTVSCLANDGTSLNNVYSRSFKLNQDFSISNDFKIDSIQFGVEQITSSLPNGYPILLKFSTTDLAYPTGQNTVLSIDTVFIKDTSMALLTFPVSVNVPALKELIVEIGFIKNDTVPTFFYIASNSYGETGPTYLLSNDCQVTVPTTTTDIGYSGTQLILSLFGHDCIPTYSSIQQVACESFTSPSGKYVWTNSGTYIDVIQNSVGCDSIINVDLTVNTINPEIIQVDNYLVSAQDNATYEWINCASQLPILGETKQIFKADEFGDYSLLITKNGCEFQSDCFSVLNYSAGINELESDVAVYPNPTQDFVTVTLHQLQGNENYILTDISGVQLISNKIESENISISLAGFKAGIYMLKICNADSCNSYSIVKK